MGHGCTKCVPNSFTIDLLFIELNSLLDQLMKPRNINSRVCDLTNIKPKRKLETKMQMIMFFFLVFFGDPTPPPSQIYSWKTPQYSLNGPVSSPFKHNQIWVKLNKTFVFFDFKVENVCSYYICRMGGAKWPDKCGIETEIKRWFLNSLTRFNNRNMCWHGW